MAKKRETKNNKNNINDKNNILNIISIIASLVAVIISGFSLLYTQKAYQLAENQDIEKKTAIWIGKYNEESEEITFSSSSEGITLQLAKVYFPSEIDENTWYINPPGYSLPTVVLQSAITELTDKTIEREQGSFIVTEADIPIVIESKYIVAGSSASIKSQYNIRYIVSLSDDESILPYILIEGVWFDKHLSAEENPRKYIDYLWNTRTSIQ